MSWTERLHLAVRDREIATLTGLLRRSTQHGRGQLALVEGAPGCGKTALLDTFARQASESDAVVLRASCAPNEQEHQLAVTRQLVQTCRATGDIEAMAHRLDEDTLAVMLADDPCTVKRNTMRIHNDLMRFLAALAAQRPLVIVVDDAQYIDESSKDGLLYVMRRLRLAPLTVVVATLVEQTDPQSLACAMQLEPDCQLVTLGPLPEHGVRRMLTALSPELSALAVACHARTGGNPLLIRAYVEDHRRRDAGPPDPALRSPGTALRRALFKCLHRVTAPARRVASGMAVLGPDATPANLAQLLDIEPAEVRQASRILASSGLLADGRLRHADIAAAVLANMAPADRAEMHARAAELLFAEGATPVHLAQHLVQAQLTRMPWSVCTLHEAANRAAADGDLEFAVACLELAVRDGRNQGLIKAAILRLAWSTDPALGDRHVSGLCEALRQGELEAGHAAVLIRHQLWHGRINEAVELMAMLHDLPDRPRARHATELTALRLWLSYTYPPLATMLPAGDAGTGMGGHGPGVGPGTPGREPLLAGADLGVRAVGALAGVLTNQPSARMVTDARLALKSLNRDAPAYPETHAALLALVYSDAVGDAALHCDRLLTEASRRKVPIWHALLTATKAEIARRLGDLPAAERYARAAIEQIPETHWGVTIGLPLSTLLLALVSMGKLDEAGRLIERPIPPALLQTGQGLVYRYACGRYHLAQRSPGAAQQSFLECGELARAWGLDMPTFVPWRGGIAEAQAVLGRPELTGSLLTEQLSLLPGRYPRARGISQRQLAAAVPLDERRRLLTSAVQLLQSSGDSAELAHALYDLAAAERALGEAERARLHIQLAMRTAARCGTSLIIRMPWQAKHATTTTEYCKVLTLAEQRVAMLAARGQTNRQIAQQLSVTPSTVEQHLTRVFRKLKVKDRKDLPSELGMSAIDVAMH